MFGRNNPRIDERLASVARKPVRPVGAPNNVIFFPTKQMAFAQVPEVPETRHGYTRPEGNDCG